MTKITTLKALRPALRQIGLDCWTSVAGGGGGYVIGTTAGDVLETAGTLGRALTLGNRKLREAFHQELAATAEWLG